MFKQNLAKNKVLTVSLTNHSEDRVLILSICLVGVVLLVVAAIDASCYFTKRQGLLNKIITSQVRRNGNHHLSSENSTSEGTEEELQRELSPLNE